MSERCFDAMECRPEDLRCALSIHTQKITDSCRDKDCIEDLRVYLTRESQTVLDAAAAAKVRSAELIYTAVDVSPLAFHRNHYAIDLTFYYKVIADAAVGPCRPAAICGLALFSKRAVLCGENSGAHIFRSDCPGNAGGSLPTAVVEVMGTNSQVHITAHIPQNKPDAVRADCIRLVMHLEIQAMEISGAFFWCQRKVPSQRGRGSCP